MSRSGYSDDCYGWQLIMWRGAVASAIRGERGQRLLRDMIAALDAMPVKELVAHELDDGSNVCAMGAVCRMRGVDAKAVNSEDAAYIAPKLDIAPALAKEIAFENDDGGHWKELPSARWHRMRAWAAEQLKKPENQ